MEELKKEDAKIVQKLQDLENLLKSTPGRPEDETGKEIIEDIEDLIKNLTILKDIIRERNKIIGQLENYLKKEIIQNDNLRNVLIGCGYLIKK